MSKMTDLLLRGTEAVKAVQERELEVSRLSAALGEPFKVKIRALSIDEFDGLPKGDEFRVHIVVKAMTEPSMKDEQLRRAYAPAGRKNPLLPTELVKTLFLAGEIANIATEVLTLSGYSDDSVRSISSVDDAVNAAAAEVEKN